VFDLTHHTAAGVAGVLQVVVQQFGGSVLERFREGSQQHGELWGVELKQSDEHHLCRLQDVQNNGSGLRTQLRKFRWFPWFLNYFDHVFPTDLSLEAIRGAVLTFNNDQKVEVQL